MSTVCQLLALPACFLLIGLLRGDSRSLVLAFVRRVARLTGTDVSARVELLRRAPTGAACEVVESIRRRRAALAKAKARKKPAAAVPRIGPAAGARPASVKPQLVPRARWFIVHTARPYGAPLRS